MRKLLSCVMAIIILLSSGAYAQQAGTTVEFSEGELHFTLTLPSGWQQRELTQEAQAQGVLLACGDEGCQMALQRKPVADSSETDVKALRTRYARVKGVSCGDTLMIGEKEFVHSTQALMQGDQKLMLNIYSTLLMGHEYHIAFVYPEGDLTAQKDAEAVLSSFTTIERQPAFQVSTDTKEEGEV